MMTQAPELTISRFSTGLEGAGLALGFALGGFFDGILLHQILQWHHLLSGIEAARGDIRLLILADSLFHLAMYVIAALGLWLLWRTRAEYARAGSDRRLFANLAIGFGAWHVFDGLLSHWLLGLHRIRMDTEMPLFWDLLWFFLFGVLPLTAGWILRRGDQGGGRPPSGLRMALVFTVILAAALARLPASQEGPVIVLFGPQISSAQAIRAISNVGGKLLWTDPSGQAWAIDVPHDAGPARLYLEGAVLVSRSILPAGCFDWLKA